MDSYKLLSTFLVACTQFYSSLCWSVGQSVITVLFIAYSVIFKPKSEFIFTTAPAQQLVTVQSCIRPCLIKHSVANYMYLHAILFLLVHNRIYNSVADYNSSWVGVGCMSDVCMSDVPIPFSRWDSSSSLQAGGLGFFCGSIFMDVP